MKKFLKRCSLPFLLFLTSSSCFLPQNEKKDLSDEESNDVANQLGANRTADDFEDGEITSYGGDIFNLTHRVLSHWNLLPSHEVNQNGGFILHLDGYNGDLAVASTTVKGSRDFEQINKLVFSLGGLNGRDVEAMIKIDDSVVRKELFLVETEEQDFELFIGGLNLSRDFEVVIKLKDDVTYTGDLVVRDIHFSAALLERKETPYVYNNEKEFSLVRDSARHWEVNHQTDKKYDNKLILNVNAGDDVSLFAKTTVIGSEKLKRFKSLIIEAKAEAVGSTGKNDVKLVVGNKEYIIEADYYSPTRLIISLENIDPTKDFDIYFYPSVNGDKTMKVEVANLYLTSYVAAPLDVDGTEPTFNAMENSFYHWSLSGDIGEEIIFHDDDSFEVFVSEDSNSELAITNNFSGLTNGDYNKAIIRLRGPAGNSVKISPVFAVLYSYYPDYYFTYELTGEEQEIVIDFSDYKITGFSIFPNINPNNIPGTIEVLSIDYFEPENTFNLSNVENKVGANSIDITQEIKDYWQYQGNNVTIDENGLITYDLSAGDESLAIKLRRSHAFDNTPYKHLAFSLLADSRFNSKCVSGSGTNSGYVDIIPDVVQRVAGSLSSNVDFSTSNMQYEFYKYSSYTPTVKILSVKLVKEPVSLTDEDYQNLAKDFDDSWNTTLDYTLVNEKAQFVVPNDGLTYYNYTRYRPSEQIKFNQATLEFDALDKPLTLSLKIDSHTPSSEQVIQAGATSATFTLTPPSGYWYTYSDYRVGLFVKNESDGSANFRLSNFSLTRV